MDEIYIEQIPQNELQHLFIMLILLLCSIFVLIHVNGQSSLFIFSAQINRKILRRYYKNQRVLMY